MGYLLIYYLSYFRLILKNFYGKNNFENFDFFQFLLVQLFSVKLHRRNGLSGWIEETFLHIPGEKNPKKTVIPDVV